MRLRWLIPLLLASCVHVKASRPSRLLRRPPDGRVLPILQVLPTGPLPGLQATGQLQTSWGAGFTTTRATTKWCLNSSGLLVSQANGVPCVDASGVNVEASATNLLEFSQALATSPWNAFGSAPPVAPMVTNGTTDVTDVAGGSSATKVVFPATTTTEEYSVVQQTMSSSLTSGTYTCGGWIRLLSGTSTFYISLDPEDGTHTFQAFTACALNTTWKRFSVTTQFTNGKVPAFNIGSDTRAFNANEPTMAAQTVYLSKFKCESGSVLTSDTDTTGATGTRAADSILSGTFTIGTTPSFSADVILAALPASSAVVLQAYNSSTDKWTASVNSSGALICAYNNGTNFPATSTATLSAGTRARVRCYYDGANVGACVNGLCTTAAQSFTATSTAYPFYLGSDHGSASFLGGGVSNICASVSTTGCP